LLALVGYFAESYIKIGKFKAQQSLFFAQHTTPPLPNISICNMMSLLPIVARVEAAIQAYISVRDFADKDKWLAKFNEEKVSTHLHGIISINLHLK
jgi:hypothetical protein